MPSPPRTGLLGRIWIVTWKTTFLRSWACAIYGITLPRAKITSQLFKVVFFTLNSIRPLSAILAKKMSRISRLSTPNAPDRSFRPKLCNAFGIGRTDNPITNAICKACVWDIVKQETRQPVAVHHIEAAKEKLILPHTSHIDSLA